MDAIIKKDSYPIIVVEFYSGEVKRFLFPQCFDNNYLDFVDIEISNEYKNIRLDKKSEEKNENNDSILEKVSRLNLSSELSIFTVLSDDLDKNDFEILIEATSNIIFNYYKKNLISTGDRQICIFTFAWISFENYNGNFWDYIREKFYKLYQDVDSEQRLEKLIRTLISEQDKYLDSRYITNVLVHAAIPKYYLKKFYDFVFDIYRINFDYHLNDYQMEDILIESLNGLVTIFNESNNSKDELKLNVTQKTYILIKSTKYALIHYKTSMIEILKIMLQVIDEWYYSFSRGIKYPNILVEKFNEWTLENEKPSLIQQRSNEYVTKPEYRFDSTSKTVRILFPKYLLKNITSNEFDKISVELSIDNDICILDNKEFKILEKIGFNTLEILSRKMDVIPKSISFIIKKDQEIIINTGDILNRKFIIFNDNGKEISNNKEKDGMVYVIFPKNIEFTGENVKVIRDSPYFDIAVFMVDKNVIYKCGDESIYFSKMINPGIYGKEKKNVIASINGKEVKVFNEINNFVFESQQNSDDLILEVNNKKYDLSSLEISKSKRGLFWSYNVVIDKNMLFSNSYVFRIYNKLNNNFESKSDEFLVDEDLDFLIIETDVELKNEVTIVSSFQTANFDDEIYDFSTSTYFQCEFRLGNNKIKYKIDPLIKRYKWNLEDPWKKIEDLELQENKLLYLSSLDNNITIINKDGAYIRKIELSNDKNKGISSLELIFLSQLSQANDYVNLIISDLNDDNYDIRIYLRQTVIMHTIDFEQNKIRIKFNIKNFMKNTLEFNLFKDNECINTYVLSSDILEIEGLDFYIKYGIEIIEKDNLFLDIEKKRLYNSTFSINDSSKLEGKLYSINEVFINYFDKKDNLKYELTEIKSIVIKFKEKLTVAPHEYSSLNVINKDVYKCRLYKLDFYGKLIPFIHLKEIYVEITSNKNTPILNLVVEDSNGEGLLISEKRKNFLVDSLDEDSQYSIDYIIVDTERNEYK